MVCREILGTEQPLGGQAAAKIGGSGLSCGCWGVRLGSILSRYQVESSNSGDRQSETGIDFFSCEETIPIGVQFVERSFQIARKLIAAT